MRGQRYASNLNFLKESGVPEANMQGQRYDGVSNMSSGRICVQAHIREEAPSANFVHCNAYMGTVSILLSARPARYLEYALLLTICRIAAIFFLSIIQRELTI